MSSSRRYAWIGLFVVGAIIISAVGIALFFGGGFGRSKTQAIMVFRVNVTGLEIGTPVEFRGMKIGEVRRLRTIYDPKSKQVLFPVYAEFTGTIEIPGYDMRSGNNEGLRSAWLSEMVERGLRAQLQTKSFVTGQQMIMLDFLADDVPKFTKIEKDVLEIPTARSPNEAIVDALRELPVREIVFEGQKLVTHLNRLMLSEDGKAGPLPKMIEQFAVTGKTLNEHLPQLARELQLAGQDLRTTMTALTRSSRNFDRQSVRVVDGLNTTLGDINSLARNLTQNADQAERRLGQNLDKLSERLEASLTRIDRSMARLDFALSEDSVTGAGLQGSLSEVAAAAHALRQIADQLNRQPNSLLFGHTLPEPAVSHRPR